MPSTPSQILKSIPLSPPPALSTAIPSLNDAAVRSTASSQFTPRTSFPVSANIKRTYYLGHHRSTLRQLSALRSTTDFYIDVRDYRIPFSSANPLLERALSGLPRIIVYNKLGLGIPNPQHFHKLNKGKRPSTNHDPDETEEALRRIHGPGTQLVFLDALHPSIRSGAPRAAARPIQQLLAAVHRMTLLASPHRDLSVRPATGVVVGMPNVGKSTLLNALRSAARGQSSRRGADGAGTSTMKNTKVARTGERPGVTRSISERARLTAGAAPPEGGGGGGEMVSGARIYARDTPGVFLPYVTSAHEMLRLALTGCVSSAVVPQVVLVDYLLYWMNLVSPTLYTHNSESGKTFVLCPQPTNDVSYFLQEVSRRLGKLKRFGVADEEGAAEWVLKRYRQGLLGRFVLDDVSDEQNVRDYLAKEERTSAWWAENHDTRNRLK